MFSTHQLVALLDENLKVIMKLFSLTPSCQQEATWLDLQVETHLSLLSQNQA